jgi:hypothetical protein
MAGLSGRLRDWNHWRMAAGESGHWPLSPASAEASEISAAATASGGFTIPSFVAR